MKLVLYIVAANVLKTGPDIEPDKQLGHGKKDDNSSARAVVIIAVSIAACVIVVVALVGICLRKKIKRRPIENPEIDKAVDEITTVESLQYGYSTIKAATNDFSDKNKLGEGGFGVVYKGKLPNDQEIAVKRLSKNSGQGDVEFKNEILLLAKLQHRNLVRLLGFSIQGSEKLLVYEFVRNGSLDLCMSDPTKRSCLDWDKRYKIIGGIARGLVYLHEDSQLRIIHRDLKPGNVLLDREMNPKIADFGMARLFEQDETQGNTSKIAGT
ncbi:PREDICTED: cysteine-rich receptor-like protein kinase 6 [Erythranthe guttata]|uniref:cysteine-rich receptor-like protein kinase 6 n=1 Tax=Erythranthe guttata TaxID=4155 RepID=UPI00064DC61A|nr:PREDICTED: cysteine-rich receptor-like protein kinase 6 [Erythranthe guttata]|eukprot:XP_012853637.1 PREDICTED: cysteine-rich receptor-like protein kinase 6 [Erythranthe guttata]